jgi:signal peptidase I
VIEELVLEELRHGPVSGGKIIERLQASGAERLRGRFALVYGALANLRRAGKAEVLEEGEGEAIWGLPRAPARPPLPPGFPPTFALVTRNDLGAVDRGVTAMTKGLPPHLFEEIRRVVVADAERRAFHGEPIHRAISGALGDLGPSGPAVRAFLRRAAKGGEVRLVLRRRPRPGVLAPLLLTCGLLVAARLFVVGIYSVPSNSMAPALCAADEGGDARVLVNLLAWRFGSPRRGDVAVFVPEGGDERVVKRVMGLPRESVTIEGGDVHVDGVRLVKERALLDRVKVPLYSLGDLKAGVSPPLRRTWRWPDGRFQPGGEPTAEAVAVARVVARGVPFSATLTIDDGLASRHTVVLKTDVYGAGAAAAGAEIASGPDFLLKPGVPREIWATNCDHVFRVEIDGREVARAALARRGPAARVSLVTEGEGSLESVDIARDLHYVGRPGASPSPVRLGEDEYFLLGDNSESSKDSRYFGPVRRSALLGRVVAVAWPPSRMRLFR